jgi:endoglycosylceramidase
MVEHRGRRWAAWAALAVVGASLVACSGDDEAADGADGAATASTTVAAPADAADAAPVRAVGEWFVDADGRVVQLRGVNEVYKADPFHPSADGFGVDDGELLAELGFNTVRLGVNLEGLMPAPGEVSTSYLDAIETSVRDLADAGIWVVLDFHQDGFSPKYNGNGFPDWMAIDDGLDNPPDAVFPLYYVQNPAMQRAWEHFWANDPGPDGVPVQDHVVTAVEATAERFADAPNVLGYEAINEPFPGADYQACIEAAGCAELEQERIAPFSERFEAAVRTASDDQLVWIEPFVLFNFGEAPTSLPGSGNDQLLAAHVYALDPAGDQAVVDHMVDARDRDDKPVLITEFGASTDPELLQRHVQMYDDAMVPWLFWAYNENIVSEREQPASLEVVNDLDAVRALVRPYPSAVAGVPTGWSWDPEAMRFELTYDTAGLEGAELAADATTEVQVPALAFPDGYEVASLQGATVTSEPCAPLLTLVAEDGASAVALELGPADGEGACG